MSNLDNMKGNRVLVVGFGRSGQAAARVMARMGAEVSVQDAKKESQIDSNLLTFYRGQGVTFYLDSMPPDMGAFDQIILSPGASPELGFVQEGKEKGAEIIGELEIAYRVGYRDPHYFSATFKRIQGESPREYRMRGRSDDANRKQ